MMVAWMLYALAFSGLLIVAGHALEGGLRALGRPTRGVWTMILAAALVGPALLPLVPRQSTPDIAISGAVTSVGAQAADAAPRSALALALGRLDAPLAALWVVLSVFGVIRLAAGVALLRRDRARWSVRDVAGTTCFISRDVGPAVVAIPDARIVLPEWILDLDPASLSLVVRHEREHVRARDAWLVIAGAIAAALMPWNPGVWIIERRLRLAVEMDCDARVLAGDRRVAPYGLLLVSIAQRQRLMTSLAAMLTESTSHLEQRITAMTTQPTARPRLRAAALIAVAIAAIVVACAIPSPDITEPQDGSSARSETTGDAPASNPQQASYEFTVEQPAYLEPTSAPPHYPNQLRAANIEGQVIARFVVDTTGQVDMRTVEVIKSDHDAFSRAVENSLPGLKFRPARVGTRPVKQLVQMPFAFSLAR